MELLLFTLMILAALIVAGLRLILRLRAVALSPVFYPVRLTPFVRRGRTRWWLSSLLLLAAGGLSWLAVLQLPLLSEAWAQSDELSVTKRLSGEAKVGTFQSGEEIVFTIAYRCAEVDDAYCEDVTITDTFASDLEFLEIDSLLPGASYSQNGQQVVIDLGDVNAGDTGILQMRARFRLGTLPDTTATNRVTMGSSNATPRIITSNPVTVTASGSFKMTANKSVVNNNQTGVIGPEFRTTYQLNVCNPDDGLGGVALQNATVTDILPAQIEPILPIPNGGVYSTTTRQVIWSGLTIPVTDGCYTLNLPVRFSGVTSGDVVNNQFSVSGNPADEPATPISLGPTDTDLQLRDPYYDAALNKSATTASDHPDDPGVEELAGRPVTYTLTYNNIGTLPITNVVVTDNIPSEIVTITQVAVNPVTPTQVVTLSYELNDSGTFILYGAYTASTSVDLSGLSRVTGLRWELGDIPFDAGWTVNYTGVSSSTLPGGDSFTNCATGEGFSEGSDQLTTACQTVEIIGLRAIPRVDKTIDDSDPHMPEEVVNYTLRVYNDDVAHNNVVAPITLIDLLPEELEVVVFDSGAWRPATITDSWYAYTGAALTMTTAFTPSLDPPTHTETLLRWRWDDYELPPGEELRVSFNARIKKGTPPGNLDNVALQLWDEPGTLNELFCVSGQVYTDTLDLDGDGNTSEQGCQSENEPTQVGVFLAMKSEKFVWGELDSGWNKDGWTVPGGNVDYRMVITNISNVTTTDLVVYDIFPVISDTGVVDLTSRDSEWRPNLQQPISLPITVPLTIQYSRSQNPCRPELLPKGPEECVDDWSTSLPADPTSVQAIRLEFCEDDDNCLELAPDTDAGPGGRLEFTWNMQAPNDAPADPARAWNSFGFTAEGGGLQLLPAEPNKVGIRVQRYLTDTVNLGDYVWLDVYGRQNDGIQQPEEPGLNGVRVELLDENGDPVDENGDGENDYRLTGDDQLGNPGYYLFVGLPPTTTYKVRFYPPLTYTLGPELPVSYNTSLANQGGDDAFDSDGVVTGTNGTGDYIETERLTTTLVLTTDLRWDQGLWLPTDYGDAPNTYATQAATLISPALAARHVILPGIYMGAGVDDELDGPISTGFGDDTDVNPDDEDGVTFEVYTGTLQTPTGVMIIGDTAELTVSTTVPASYTGYLNAWLDFNDDGDFSDPGERIATNRTAPTGGGDINFTVNVPSTAISGTTYARFRFSTESDLPSTGGAWDGEVEDYPILLLPGDYGDLPNGYGTTKASNGARHPIWPTNNPTLGLTVDDELDGQPNDSADGDDTTGAPDDEDGVSFDSDLIPGEVMTVTVTAANVVSGYLNAWIDFNGDGDFSDTNERLATDRVLTAGTSLVLTTTVPANADQNDDAYARFRFSSRPGLSATGPALDGEVEDYAEPILPLDYGDLPNTYPTEFDDNGARHVIRTGGNPTLGTHVDAELDGQDNNAADGDDTGNSNTNPSLIHGSGTGDDENGVTFNSPWVPGKVATITVSSLITADGGADGQLNAWIDFNNDDDFNDSGEQIAANRVITAGGSTAITFTVPSTASVGNVYSRFRFNSSGNLTPAGLALDGEVEDYRTEIIRLDYGDLPDVYGTTDSQNGAYHVIRNDRYLGSRVDAELDGQPSPDALLDDTSLGTGVPNNGDDEDGIIFNTPLAPGTVATLTIVTGGSGNGRFNGWLDFNGDDDFDDPGERIFTNTTLAGGGSYSRSFTVPANAQLGQTYARFRFSDNNLSSPVGSGGDGEVEDYAVRIVELDYGDAPDGSVAGLPDYATRRANDGARHIISEAPNPTLGSTVDGEPDGQPSLNANGDDTDLKGDDEDGVVFSGPLVPGESVVITVTASVTAGLLTGWIDFDHDGAFEAGEVVADDIAISAGSSITRSITVPVTATQAVTTYSRFRFSTIPNLGPTGLANDGEVEDYPLPVLPLDYGDLPDSGSPSYPTTRLTNGPRHIINTGGNPTLGGRVDADSDGQPSFLATDDDNTDSPVLTHGGSPGDDEDGVAFDTPWVAGKVATITVSSLLTASGGADGLLNAWIDFTGNGVFDSGEQIATNLNLTAGSSRSISFTVPLSVPIGNLYSRFRFSTQSDLTPTGLALDGEVEDYRRLVVELDYGDLPDGYGTTDAASGAYHLIDPALYLGSTVDDELDGQPTESATGDDTNGSDDEDGVIFDPLIAGRTSALTITAVGSGGSLSGWIDWDADDQFDPDEQVFSDRVLVAGSNSLSVTVPLTASLGDDIYMRFRYSTQSGLPPTGSAPDGEVEDYATTVAAYDFGDALNSYSTQLAQDGARHVISPALYLGSRVDVEDDGRPSANALGDDTQIGPGTPDDGNDEDGVEFSSLAIGQTATLTVTASSAGRLDAWLDFGDDGDWSAAIDQIFTDEPLLSGQNILTFTVPETATMTGATFARFRLSSAGGLSYTGPAPDGEVEDYLVALAGYDFGDLPDSFATTALAGGPNHLISPTLYLGNLIDPEGDGQPSPNADGDDANPPGLDDEDGISFDTPLIPGEVATITVLTVGSGNFSGWLDFNGSGQFDPGERVFTNTALSPGSTVLSFTVPATATPGNTGARFRYTSGSLTDPTGPALDGEVEDYLVTLNQLDFGDLPDDASSPAGYAAQTYPTGLADNGARHVILAATNPTLGSTVDAEGDGQADLEALGDDADGAPDDEDGVTFTGALVPGETSLITVTASVTDGRLNAWIDFNGDGDLTDTGEQIAIDQSLTVGTSLGLTVNVPLTATRGITTYSRFRFSHQSGLAPTGLALDGEVEDYAIRIAMLDFGDLPNDAGNHPTLVTDNGARHIINPAANPVLGLHIDAEAEGQPGPDADGDDSAGDPDDEDGVVIPPLIPGETITVTITYSNPTGVTAYLNGWLDTDGDGTLTHILADEPVAPGSSGTLPVPVFVSGAPISNTGYSRFRISTQPGLGLSGLAPDGEVEDYVGTIVGMDFGDLPDDDGGAAGYAAQTYPTQLSDDGARHAIMPTNNPALGATVDAEQDGQPALQADGDDTTDSDDEEGVAFSGLLVPGEPFVITATVAVTGAYLNAWIDFNGDGDLVDAGEQIAADQVVIIGDNVFTITVPFDAQQDVTTYGRFRLSSDPGLTPTGLAYDGEVEDYALPTQFLASLGDFVWLDEDGDGEQGGGEPGLENVTVVLWRDTIGNGTPTTPVLTRTTTITGYYHFDNLVPGVAYQVEFKPPSGYHFTVPDTISDTLDSDADLSTGRAPIVTLTPGERNDSLDAGLYRASLTVDKAVSVAQAAPTQVVTYTLTVTNTGDVPLSTIRITDTLDAGLAYVAGSANLTPTSVNGQVLVWIVSGRGGELGSNESLGLTFRVQVPAAASTTIYQNRVAAIGTHPTGTTDPPVTDQVSVVVNDPAVALDKSLVAPGAVNGVVTFTIRITNTGPSVLDELPLFDAFNGPVAYSGGTPPADVIDNANRTLTWRDLTGSFGRNLAPGETFELVTVFQVLEDSVRFSMQNVARVPGGAGGANDVLDNPTTEVSDSIQLDNVPTAIELKTFTAERQGQDILVTWETAVEINNYAFRLMRSPSGNLTEAVEVALVPGQGAGSSSGASYSYLDQGIEAGRSYTYWLVDIDLEGGETVNGPVVVSPTQPTGGGQSPTYLPVIIK